jgi:hypothetical protein
MLPNWFTLKEFVVTNSRQGSVGLIDKLDPLFGSGSNTLAI